MIKNYNTIANPVLSSAIDSIEATLQCSKYFQVAKRIEVSVPGVVTFQNAANKELAQRGFGTCLIRSYADGFWDASIIIDMKNCQKAGLTEREIGAVVLHELGHLLNEPELPEEPTFEFCYIHGHPFSWQVLEEVRESNGRTMEIFADSYANKHGYGEELISGFHKQNDNFEQQIGYCSERIQKIESQEYFEGNIMSVRTRNNGGYRH